MVYRGFFNLNCQIPEKENENLFGCGLLLYLLTNNFSSNDSNIFIKQMDNMLFSNNVWD